MAQRKFHEKVETWIVVTIIAALVWLYAEATVLKQETDKSVQLLINEPNATQRYEITPNTIDLTIDYRGSSGQIQQFNELTTLPLVTELDPTGITEPTERTIILKDALIRAGLGDIGITEFEVEPDTQIVKVQPRVEVVLPIVVDATAVNLNGDKPVAEPDSLPVTVPFEIAEQLRGKSIIATLTGDSEGDTLDRVETNVPLTYPPPLAPNSPWSPPNPPLVRVPYTLANDIETAVVGTVLLHVDVPVDIQLNYSIRPQNPNQTHFLRDVQFQGPADLIARLRDDPSFKPTAELRIPDPTRLDPNEAQQIINIRPEIVTPDDRIRPVQLPEVMPVIVRRRDTPGS